ncbi:unnamed protein product [Vicia faba]|uniref:Zinc finger BED domain-containing protein RICESLEEPER 2-like n=1 Tax=Vicia faba TaxID=3906 RepID=A0AAV1AUQ3_VICFA|nr:unnamed protein product [Vicia faba]
MTINKEVNYVAGSDASFSMVENSPLTHTTNLPQTIDLDKQEGDNVQKKKKRKVGEADDPKADDSNAGDSGFCHFMSVTQPRFPLPGRVSIARDCLSLYASEKHKLRSIFTKTNQSVCLTTDAWTSVQNINYMVLTAHFIDQDWKLHKRILNFCLITSHKGEIIRRKIEKCLEGYMIDKVFPITVDNAVSNDVAIAYLKYKMEDWNSHPLKGENLHIICCSHILNLVVNDRLKLKHMHFSLSKIRSVV